MKIDRSYDITADEFYDYLEEHLLADIEKATGRSLKPKDLEPGLRFSKVNENDKTNSLAPIYITINDYQRGSIYQATARSGAETAVTTYRTSMEDGKLHVVFTEQMSEFDGKKDQMGKVKRGYYEFTYLARMSRTLNDMIAGILRKKKDLPEPKAMPGTKSMQHLSRKAQEHLVERAEKKAARKSGR